MVGGRFLTQPGRIYADFPVTPLWANWFTICPFRESLTYIKRPSMDIWICAYNLLKLPPVESEDFMFSVFVFRNCTFFFFYLFIFFKWTIVIPQRPWWQKHCWNWCGKQRAVLPQAWVPTNQSKLGVYWEAGLKDTGTETHLRVKHKNQTWLSNVPTFTIFLTWAAQIMVEVRNLHNSTSHLLLLTFPISYYTHPNFTKLIKTQNIKLWNCSS